MAVIRVAQRCSAKKRSVGTRVLRGLRVPAFPGRVREPALLYVRVELAAVAGRDEKFLVRANEC